MQKIALKYREFVAMTESKYYSFCSFLGIEDSTESRVFMAVCVGVSAFYVLFGIIRILFMIASAICAFM